MTLEPEFDDAHIEHFPVPPRMFPASEFATREMKPRPWLVQDIIPGCQVSTVDGDGGGGKSTLGIQLGVCAVTGRSWLNQNVARGPVIYLAAEDDEEEVHRRVDAISVHLRVRLEELGDLHIWPLATDDPALVVSDRDDTLRATARWAQLVAGVERIKPVALILDSRADVFGGNEISRAQARGFIAMLRQLAVKHGVAIILLSHPSLAGISSGSGSSGSTHWRNAVRGGLYLRRPDDPDAHPDLRVLEVKKNNYGPSGLQLTIRWAVGAFVLEDGGGRTSREEAVAKVDGTFLRLLSTYNAQGRRVSDLPSANYAPTVFSHDPERDGATRSGFMSAMLRLFAAGKIRVEEVGPASKRRRRLVVVTDLEEA